MKCLALDSYIVSLLSTISDIDECMDMYAYTGSSVCGSNAYCMNTEGSYTCECNTGFHKDGTDCTRKFILLCNLNELFTCTSCMLSHFLFLLQNEYEIHGKWFS